jgi:Bacteriophage probable baseplate hub protein
MNGTAVAPVAGRPGQFYFTPGIRIRKLGRTLQSSGEAGADIPGHMLADLVSATVTLPNTGLATYTLTLNNAILTTARDRADASASSEDDGSASTTAATQPWPRYKYNAFDLFTLGDRLRIDFRYWPDAPDDADEKQSASQLWVPMVCGPITDMEFTFVAEEGARVVVSGQDDLQPLMDKSERRTPLQQLGEVAMVRRVLTEAGFPITTIADPRVPYPAFADTNSNGLNADLQKGQAFYDFIQKLCERLDFELFLEFSDLGDADSAVEVHFEPYRGRSAPDTTDLYTLERDRNLISFKPKLSVAKQYTDVEVRGRHRDPQQPVEVLGRAAVDQLTDELHIDAAQDGNLSTAREVRRFFFPNQENRAGPPNVTNLDQTRADWYALALLRKNARELLTVQGTTLGLPRLRPGRHVEIRGMRAPFDGFYYVTQTVHTLSGKGLQTAFTASRPGMELPPYRLVAGQSGGSQ